MQDRARFHSPTPGRWRGRRQAGLRVGQTQPVGSAARTAAPLTLSGQIRPASAAGAWPQVVPLFPPLSAAAREALERLPEALAKVRPLSAAHRRSLPEDVADLSRLLTTERGALNRPYWSSPAFVSAYLYYFLPWNLLRLTRLLSGLPLPDPGAAVVPESEALLLDAGSGPLTLPLALWLARPLWREAPVRVLGPGQRGSAPGIGQGAVQGLGRDSRPKNLARAYCTRAFGKAWRVMPRRCFAAHRARPVLRSADRGCTGRQQCGLG